MLGCDLYSDFIVSSYIAEKLAYFFSALTLYFFYFLHCHCLKPLRLK